MFHCDTYEFLKEQYPREYYIEIESENGSIYHKKMFSFIYSRRLGKYISCWCELSDGIPDFKNIIVSCKNSSKQIFIFYIL